MAKLTTEQYLALSALAYSSLSRFESASLGQILEATRHDKDIIKGYKDKRTGEISPEFQALTTMSRWQIIAQSSSSYTHTITQRGHTRKVTVEVPFSATAFQNPETGEIVFAFRGTNNKGDWATDLQIALGGPDSSIKQFQLAKQFVFETLNRYGQVQYKTQEAMFSSLNQNSNVSFTGHSLGGGLAQCLGNLFVKGRSLYV